VIRLARVAFHLLAVYDLSVTDAAKKLLEEFNALPEEDQRWFLREVGDLDDDDELHPDWIPEIQRRIDDIRRGEVKTSPAKEAIDRVRVRLQKKA